jgi:hypothetical protein
MSDEAKLVNYSHNCRNCNHHSEGDGEDVPDWCILLQANMVFDKREYMKDCEHCSPSPLARIADQLERANEMKGGTYTCRKCKGKMTFL